MNLLVDIGNSRIKWARQSASGLIQHQAAARNGLSLTTLLDRHWTELPPPEKLLVANVAGSAIADELKRWSLEVWKAEPQFATVSSVACGVRNGYREPAQMGVDRWLAVIAAWNKYHSPVCVIDCGTAVTIDAVDAGGQHLGGLILPGLAMMQESLSQRAPGIPRVISPASFTGLADNTAAAVSGGCVTAIVASIERTVMLLRQQLGTQLTCLITGGDAQSLLVQIDQRQTESSFHYEPHIVLEGLTVLYQGEAL